VSEPSRESLHASRQPRTTTDHSPCARCVELWLFTSVTFDSEERYFAAGLSGVQIGLDSILEMEQTDKESEVPAAAASNIESVPGGNGNSNVSGFVPLVTVVGFHHAR
jgi:hypothetical protein